MPQAPVQATTDSVEVIIPAVQPVTCPIEPLANVPAAVADPLNADDLDSMTETLQNMASSAEPMINDFDEVGAISMFYP